METSQRVIDYLNRKRGTKPAKVKEQCVIKPTPEEELSEAWEEFLYQYRKPISVVKFLLAGFVLIIILWAGAVVSDWNDFSRSKEYIEWERNK